MNNADLEDYNRENVEVDDSDVTETQSLIFITVQVLKKVLFMKTVNIIIAVMQIVIVMLPKHDRI